MSRLRRELKWWGLFVLLPLTAALIVLDDDVPLTHAWHMVLLGGIVLVVCLLALRWVERNARLVEHGDADPIFAKRPASSGRPLHKERIP